MKRLLQFTLMILILFSIEFGAFAQIVTSGLDLNVEGTLRYEIENAADGSVLTISDLITDINIENEIVISKNITIQGTELIKPTINANSLSRFFLVDTSGSLTLDNVILINGAAEDGGAIYNNGILVINNTELNNNIATGNSGSGGAIFIGSGGMVQVSNSSFSGNIANRAGGAIEDQSGSGLGLVVQKSIFQNNNAGIEPATAAPGNGGAIHITGVGDVEINQSTFTNNIAGSEGGALWNGTGAMIISKDTITGNIANGDAADNGGGGIFNAGGTMMIDSSVIQLNAASGLAGSGGGILNDKGTLTLMNSTISDNASIRAGGGIEENSIVGSLLTLNNVTLSDNITASAPGNGGGLHITGPGNSIINEVTVSGNSASLEGGGLWNGSGNMEIFKSTIINNLAAGDSANEGGGGVFNAGGNVVIDSSMIHSNIAAGASGSGGGILNDGGILTVSNTSISENTSVRAGGGIEENSQEGRMLTLANVTLSGNITDGAPGNGGGLHITGPGNSMISGSFFSGNSASLEGGGLWNGSGMMTISNSVIMNNKAFGESADDGGAGIFNNGGNILLESESIVSGNIASGTSASGGGILSLSGDMSIVDSEISMNSANRAGGGIEIINGNLTFDNSIMHNNDVAGTAGNPAPGNGGGLHITGNDAFVTISNSSILENSAGREGGGLWNQNGSTMLVMMSTIAENISNGDASDDGGAGIFNNGGELVVSNSAIINNTDTGSESSGAAIHNHGSGKVNLSVSTISGNVSNFGGGIFNEGDTVWINAVTIADNQAMVSGGGILGDSITYIKNSIIANNSANSGMDVSGNINSEGYNLIGTDDEDIFTATESDMEEMDPMLADLNSDGKATATQELMAGSPAYNAGDPNDMFADQNNLEVFAGRRDIGASEAQNVLSGLEEVAFEASGISIFPVPVKNYLNIELTKEFSNLTGVTIFEAGSGKIVLETRLSSSNSKINLSNLNDGIYFINIFDKKQFVSKPIIKVKN